VRIIDGIPIFGTQVDEGALKQIKKTKEDPSVAAVALMADHHKGYAVPIGGVVAYRYHISPSGVGYDIACGNKAVLTDMRGPELRQNISQIMDDVWKHIAFGIGRKNAEEVDHALFDSDAWKVSPAYNLKDMARQQLGTVGSGNHYVDLFTDEEDRVWVGVHFGSRGLGHKTATYFLEQCEAEDGMDAAPAVINVNGYLGDAYIQAMNLCGQYAYAGRDWVCQKVVKSILGASILDEVHNHHNFAWKEEHNGESLWVVRKGATPAFPGQRGFVGGSMGEQSVILEGVNAYEEITPSPEGYCPFILEQQRLALFSTVHGAGRVMGRMEAKGKFKNGVCVRPPRVTNQMMADWLKKSRVELRGAGVDESPDCYKRLPEVLAEQGATIRILHTLTPVGVAMAGKDEFDPYKD
jgi:tRNA-splicing ligase RtcB (3'-phosphate/5'-hydroxy nucleic acid ligase)